MDLMAFLQILFCCFIPKIKKSKKIPNKMAHSDHPHRAFHKSIIRRQQRKDRYQRIVFIRTRENYQDMKRRILNSIKFDSSKTLYVWCPEILVPNDFISTLLHSYGNVEHMLDKWNEGSSSSEQGSWAGAVVLYYRKEDAMFAAKDISMRCRHVKVMSFVDIIPLLVDCELLYSWTDQCSSTVHISGRRSLECEEANSLIFNLSCYGRIQKLFLNNRALPMSVICQVSYPYLTQAYIAMMMTGGMPYGNVKVSAKLFPNKRDDEILKDARECIMMVIESFFPQPS